MKKYLRKKDNKKDTEIGLNNTNKTENSKITKEKSTDKLGRKSKVIPTTGC